MMDDMLQIWIKAIEYAGNPTNYDNVIKYIRDLSEHPYKGRSGTYGINQERNEGLSGLEWLPIHIYQIQDRNNVLLYLGNEPIEDNDVLPASDFIVPTWITQ